MVISSIEDECILLVSDAEATEPVSDEKERAEENPPMSKQPKGLVAFLRHITPQTQSGASHLLTPEQKVDSEIASYLNFPATDSDQEPQGRWRREHTHFPAFEQLAKKYLCM